MKITVIIFVSVFMVVESTITNAQVSSQATGPKNTSANGGVTQNQNIQVSNTLSGSQSLKLLFKGAEGRIYIGQDWSLGTIVLRNGATIDNYFLRYNILSDQIQFIAGRDTLPFATPQEVNTATFGGHTFVYENYQSENFIRQGYFELIVPGKNKLLLKRLVTCQKPDSKNPKDESLGRYLIEECYYISKQGMPATKMICNRKSVLAVLNDHNDDIEAYLRITGNRIRTIEDLKDFVSYYNSLDEDY